VNCPKCGGIMSLWFSDYTTQETRFCREICGYKETRPIESKLFDNDWQFTDIWDLVFWFYTNTENNTLVSHDEIIRMVISESKGV